MIDPRESYSQAIDALNGGDWQQAQHLAMQLLQRMPGHGGLHFIAGASALQLQQLPRALGHLQRAAQLSPDDAGYLSQYARALTMAGRLREAMTVADAAMALPSSDAIAYDTLGVVYSQANGHRQAAGAFGRAVELMPSHANYRFNLATSFLYHGELEAAEREYEACIAIEPGYWRAHLALSQLRRQTPERNHIVRVGELLLRHQHDPDAKLYLHLSLAKEFEDIGEFPRAFDHYASGKAAHRARIAPSADRDAAAFDAVRRWFDKPRPDAAGYGSREPIFVMGMPRSGTTLVDRILSAHPNVHSAGELGNFGVVLRRASARPARSLAEMVGNLDGSFSDWSGLGRAYVESTRPGTGHTPHFVDKLPQNFLFAGFIALALGHAKLICMRRNPMDTCLSNFRQLFALESPVFDYSYDLLDIGRYYLQFDRLMRYWQQKFPGRIVELQYEQLVGAQEDSTRALLDSCGLPWDPACLAFESNAAPVATASAAQVRSRMNRDSMHRWKRYGPQLGELRKLLEDGGIRID